MVIITGLCSLVWLFSISFTVLGTFLCLKHFRNIPFKETYPPISILKPLKGVDSDLEANLRSFFCLDYPQYELLFSVSDASDPAYQVISKLIQEFPRVKARLFISSSSDHFNPKVQNLIQIYDAAEFDWIFISDSNVRANPNDLQIFSSQLEQPLGLLTAVISGRSPEGQAAHLESVFLNTFYSRWILLSHFFGEPCVMGKAMLFRKQDANRFGGIKSLGIYLAEDYMAGVAMRMLGLSVRLSKTPVVQHLGSLPFKDFWNRHIRWGRIRKSHAPVAFLMEPFVSCIGCLVLGLASIAHRFGLSWVEYTALHLSFWLALDFFVAHSVGPQLRPRFAMDWLLRELIALPLWMAALFGSSVHWRGSRIQVELWGRIKSTAA